MKYKNILFFLVLIFLCSCDMEQDGNSTESEIHSNSDIQEPIYVQLASQIDDYNWIESGNSSTNMSYLPNFDEINLDHWRAILKFGYDRANTGIQLGKRRLIFFTNSDKVEKQYSYEDITDHNANIIFAMYQSLPNGNESLTLNPYGTFPEDFFSLVKENKIMLNENHHDAID